MGKFAIGDKVFAKVRGYPAWPAKVQAVADATPNKVKYHVFFYGTLETAVCKAEDIYPYAETKDNFGKPSKRKFFNEGLAQIEGLVPVPQLPHRNAASAKNDEAESDGEGTLIIDENPAAKYGKAIKRKRDSDATVERGDEKVATNATVGNDAKHRRGSLPVQKRLKKDSTSSGGIPESKINDSASKQEIISRSGRKIKPKRFADEDANQLHNLAIAGSAVTDILDQEQNTKISNPAESSVRGTRTRDENFKALMVKVKEHRRKQLDFWVKELQMLKLAERVKLDFSIHKADPEHGLITLDEFHHIGIEPLMLKKHPDVVEDIEKLVRYSGNPVKWKYSKTQKEALAIISEKIRKKAKLLIDEFAAMFNVPDDSSFHDVFMESVTELKKKTRDWNVEKFLTMSEDPVVKRTQNRKQEAKPEQDSDKSPCSSDSDNELQEEE